VEGAGQPMWVMRPMGAKGRGYSGGDDEVVGQDK
jgi:hypothetical protein